MSEPVIPERHKIQYECLKGGGFTTPAPHYVTRLIEELGLAEYCKSTYDLKLKEQAATIAELKTALKNFQYIEDALLRVPNE